MPVIIKKPAMTEEDLARKSKLEAQAKYRDSHKEELARSAKKYRESLKERGGAYQVYLSGMTPERRADLKAKRAQYRKDNAETIRGKQREIYLRNADKYVWNNIRLRALKEGIPFDLDVEDVKAPEFCPVLGIRLERGVGASRSRKGDTIANSPSVDRKIPELGYVKGNVVVVSYKANRIKSNATLEELEAVASFYRTLLGAK